MKLFYTLIIGTILIVSSCKKKEEVVVVDPNAGGQEFGDPIKPEDLDRSLSDPYYGEWTLVDWISDTPQDINDDGNASSDLFSQWDGCIKESQLILSTEPSAKIKYIGPDDNPSCEIGFENGDYWETNYWDINLSGDDPYLTFYGSDYIEAYRIVELTETTLKIEGTGFLPTYMPYSFGYLIFEK